jgi:hypothetical protein
MLADCLPRVDGNRGAEQFGTLVHLTMCAVRQRGASLSAIRTSARSEPRTIANPASDESAHGIGNLFDSDPASVQTLRRFRPYVGSGRTSVQAVRRFRSHLGSRRTSVHAGLRFTPRHGSSGSSGRPQADQATVPAFLACVQTALPWAVRRSILACASFRPPRRGGACAPNGCDALRLFLARTTGLPDEARHTGRWGMAMLMEGPATPPPAKGQVP